MSLYFYLAIGVLLGALGSYIAEKRGRSHVEGFILGFLFGVIGLLIESFLPKKKKLTLFKEPHQFWSCHKC